MGLMCAGANGSSHPRWTCMARSTLARLAEKGPVNQSMACSSVGNNTDHSGDEHFLHFAVHKSKAHASLSSYSPHSDLVEEWFLLCPLYRYGK